MSCPFKPATPLQRFEKKVSQSKDTIDAANAGGIDETPDNNEMAVFTPKSSSTPEAFLSSVTNQNKQVFDALRVECANIEANIADAEASVLNKDRLAFVIRSSEIEYSQMHNNLNLTFVAHKEQLQKMLAARSERKLAKKQARLAIRGTKRRDTVIQRQNASAAAAARNRDTFAAKRSAFDLLISHIDILHEKQRKNLIRAQDRRLQYDKSLNELETKHLKEEIRNTIAKKFHREYQLLELRHTKDRFEMEMEGFEELNAMKDRHTGRQFEMAARHVDEHHTEKEFLRSSHESSKLQKLELSNAKELKALQTEHRIILRQLRIKQDQQIASLGGIGGGHTSGNSSKTQSGASSGFHSLIGSKTNSGVNSRHLSRGGSNEMIDVAAKGHQERNLGMKITMELAEAENDNSSEVVVRSSKTSSAALIALVKRHHAEKSNFEQQIQQEVNDFELSQEAKLAELEERQELEIRNLSGDQQTEITILKASQEKEIVMEEAMHDTEMKALLERKILNSVLETVADGIINISPDGTLIRFNKAAETIFGYTSSEVIGKNIKMLMPKRYSDDHDQYLSNYLNTGVKKVIGIPNGRRVFGLRKDGREFHLQLAVLKEEIAAEKEVQKQAELQALITKLDLSKAKADGLLSQMLPIEISQKLVIGQKVEPTVFESATIFFLDVVGFTTICSKIDPLDTVALLNEVYHLLDDVIEKYDAYKVETIGDSYMVVSGIPKKNGNRHASEICTMALHILSVVETFSFSKNPELQLKVRIGINSGPAVAGVVGSKMPRYCLFGDTVNTASRMESTSLPSKIQISEMTKKLITSAGGFDVFQRGSIDVKGKGKMMTYFLTGKDGFAHPLPASIKDNQSVDK